MDGHEADGVFAVIGLERNGAVGFAEVSEVVDELFQSRGFVNYLLLPIADEFQDGLDDGRGAIEFEILDQEFDGVASFEPATVDFFTGVLYGCEDGCASVDAIERGGEGDDAAFAGIFGDGASYAAKLLGGDGKARQGGD